MLWERDMMNKKIAYWQTQSDSEPWPQGQKSVSCNIPVSWRRLGMSWGWDSRVFGVRRSVLRLQHRVTVQTPGPPPGRPWERKLCPAHLGSPVCWEFLLFPGWSQSRRVGSDSSNRPRGLLVQVLCPAFPSSCCYLSGNVPAENCSVALVLGCCVK